MNTRTKILRLLADRRFHSGTDLGRQLGMTRAAVCKAVHALSDVGLDIEAVSGRGYRLETPAAPLDRRIILKYLRLVGVAPPQLEILEEVDSTTGYLLARAEQLEAHGRSEPRASRDTGASLHGGRSRRPASRDTGASLHGAVCLAEAQHQGRGRHGRTWIATPYSNVMLSLLWRFTHGPAIASSLSLAAGVGVLRALDAYGVRGGDSGHPTSRDTGMSRCGVGLGLKWPNDILYDGRKIAGLLADVQGEATGPCRVVLGVGVNAYISPRDGARIDQPWTDIQTVLGATVDRNRLAALVIEQLWRVCELYGSEGFAPFRQEWERHHLFAGQRVQFIHGQETSDGTVEGIDDAGALHLRDALGRVRVFHSGEISLRSAA